MARLRFDRTQLDALLAKLAPTARLVLVHDQGLYLMSQDEPRPATVPPEEKFWKHTVVYANGYDTDSEDWHEKAARAVGGDDFAEPVCAAAAMRDMLDKSVGDIVVNVTASTIGVSYLSKEPTPATPPAPYSVHKGAKSGLWRVLGPDAKTFLAGGFHKKGVANAFARAAKNGAAWNLAERQEVR